MRNNTSFKKCTKCGKLKAIEEFNWRNKSIGLKHCSCKKCTKEWKKLYYENNKKKVLGHNKKYYQDNKDHIKECNRLYRENNKEKVLEHKKQYYKNNKKAALAHQKQYCKNNRSTINKYIRNRLRTDIIFKLKLYISTQIRSSLKLGKLSKKGRHWEDLVGYTVMDLKLHLEKQFDTNMSWENYGEWHIDHRRPISWFDNAEESILKAWELSNLQPMWAHENLIKGNRWESPIKVKTAI